MTKATAVLACRTAAGNVRAFPSCLFPGFPLSVLLPRLLLLFVTVTGTVTPAVALEPPAGGYPDDPFAWEREPLQPSAIGSGRGQTHLFALGALTRGKNSREDIYFGGQLGIEFQLHEFGAIRISGFQDLVETDGGQLAHKFSSVRVGPALHLRPYRRIDLGSYLEGGLLVVDAVDGRTSVTAPEVTLGGFISIHIDSHIYLQLELERAWSNVELNGVLDDQHRSAAKLGLGLVF